MNMYATSTELFAFLFQANQHVVDRYDSLVGTMSLMATIFGVIVAIVLASSTIRQFNIDKEIRKYRDDIKKQRDTAITIVRETESNCERVNRKIKEMEEKLKKEDDGPINKSTKKELQEVKNDLEKIKADINFNKGLVSASTRTNADIFEQNTNTPTLTLRDLIELFISLGIIAPNMAEHARAVIPTYTAAFPKLTLKDLVELLISLGIIAPDVAQQARTAVSS